MPVTKSAGTEILQVRHSLIADHWNSMAWRWCALILPELLDQLRFEENTALLLRSFATRDMPMYYFT